MSSTPQEEPITDFIEKEWLTALQQGSHSALEAIFDSYYRYLVVTAYKLIHDDQKAKDLVQDVFFNLWVKREEINIQGSLKSYLRRAVVNRTIDDIRKNKRMVREEEVSDHRQQISDSPSADQILAAQDLQVTINKAIETLPDKCRTVFAMSRFENLSHKEIAEQLQISTKTIENQITKALKIIRQAVDQRSDLLLTIVFSTLSFFAIG